MKNLILKTSFIISVLMFILIGCCASNNMDLRLGFIALLFGAYMDAFVIINKGKWIFKCEENHYEE